MPSGSTSQAFEAFYLQRATAELAEDLDKLRTSADFVLPGQDGGSANTGGKNGVTDTDNSLQVLIGALRQGTAMFTAEDQARVMGGTTTTVGNKGSDAGSESG
ncbi:hypothetical protein SEPCBS119000_001926 [Sporothrix epigloea]|uniref:Ribosome assembly protein 3 n=1 Tax=Sporothrix epigloea TaxID=1892477 RepID=A0ABP0DGH5_9PEZI